MAQNWSVSPPSTTTSSRLYNEGGRGFAGIVNETDAFTSADVSPIHDTLWLLPQVRAFVPSRSTNQYVGDNFLASVQF